MEFSEEEQELFTKFELAEAFHECIGGVFSGLDKALLFLDPGNDKIDLYIISSSGLPNSNEIIFSMCEQLLIDTSNNDSITYKFEYEQNGKETTRVRTGCEN